MLLLNIHTLASLKVIPMVTRDDNNLLEKYKWFQALVGTINCKFVVTEQNNNIKISI